MDEDPSLDQPPPSGSPSDPFREGEAEAKARRLRSLALALALLAFVALVFVVTILRMSSNVLPKP